MKHGPLTIQPEYLFFDVTIPTSPVVSKQLLSFRADVLRYSCQWWYPATPPQASAVGTRVMHSLLDSFAATHLLARMAVCFPSDQARLLQIHALMLPRPGLAPREWCPGRVGPDRGGDRGLAPATVHHVQCYYAHLVWPYTKKASKS